ncbi:nonribosomal peptide synthase Pes1 [Pseudozyma hubeiensis SY62]|uniref:Nonribosomal peptide synthase Pes1 n=1 Tax=Pseudozyma hubeiensis (strain SY62) TaxID=1305764 RepID=R9PDM4_PSEHS|nr:nonribosomal peptide synthase Pes1 [Pseudozyma hubeiensis SY62]GAC99474.1 nonribosomal peptide synthase Pes1 [Pseudozyma hubeiensis SY62]
MKTRRTWLVLLGAVSLALIPHVTADDPQITDPNLAVIRDFNIVLTDNTKVNDLQCCMGLSNELPSVAQYQCFEHQDMQMGSAPGSRRLGLQFCSHLPGSTPDDASNAFKDACAKGSGEVITVDKGYCPQIWPNYKDDYKKPAPVAGSSPDGDAKSTPATPPSTAPDAGGKTTNDKDGFKNTGTFHYTLVDYSITRSLACCKGSTSPIVKHQKYKCGQRKVEAKTFMSQCAQMLPTITKPKKLNGYTTLNGDGDAVVDEKTKQQCSAMWTNAMSFTYGFCQLDYDGARDDAVKAFGDDCGAKGGVMKDPHQGMCLWNVDDAAIDSSTG